MKEIKPNRIGDLAFNKAEYLGDSPSHPSYHIDWYYPNHYFGNEKDYTKVDEEYYADPEYPCHKIHKSCFKHEECSIAIATFYYDEKEGDYYFEYIGDRPLRYINMMNESIFKTLIKYGFRQLNPDWYLYDKQD
jgi:hypothetical protein